MRELFVEPDAKALSERRWDKTMQLTQIEKDVIEP